MKKIIMSMFLAGLLAGTVYAAESFEDVTVNQKDLNGLSAQAAALLPEADCKVRIHVVMGTEEETLSAEEIGVHFSEEALEKIREQGEKEADLMPECDPEKLAAAIKALPFMQEEVKTQEAGIVYDAESGFYVIRDAVIGNEADLDALTEEVNRKLEEGDDFTIRIEDFCPEPEREAEDLEEVLKYVNAMVLTEVKITDGTALVILNRDSISAFSMINEAGELDEEAVGRFVESYDFHTEGRSRTITSPATGAFTQDGGVFYSVVDNEKEAEQVILELTSCARGEREPIYEIPMDDNGGIGDTFIEISIDEQKVYLIRDGEIEYTADCVSGCPNTGHSTPKGICYINSKYRDITLTKYQSFVNFWMAFIGSTYGLHDASWRGSFGGDIYINNGSHGCVNMYHSDVEYLYNHTEIGIPVVVH